MFSVIWCCFLSLSVAIHCLLLLISVAWCFLVLLSYVLAGGSLFVYCRVRYIIMELIGAQYYYPYQRPPTLSHPHHCSASRSKCRILTQPGDHSASARFVVQLPMCPGYIAASNVPWLGDLIQRMVA